MTAYPQWKKIHIYMVICDVGMAIEEVGSLKCTFSLFPKDPSRLTYVLLITFQPVTLVPLGYFTFLSDGVPVLRTTRKFLMVFPPLKYT